MLTDKSVNALKCNLLGDARSSGMGVHADAAHLLSFFGAFDMSRIAMCQIVSSTGNFQKGDHYGLPLKGNESVNIAFAKSCCKTLLLPWLPWMLADCFFGILN